MRPVQCVNLVACLVFCLLNLYFFVISNRVDFRMVVAREHVKFRQEMPTMDSWINSPFGKLKSYLFNVTNSEAFLKGIDKKLKLEQVGPIVYKILGHIDILERNENNITFSKDRYRNVEFLPEESVSPDILNRTIIMPNSILLGAAAKFSHEAPITGIGFDTVTIHEDLFINASVYYFLWELTRAGLQFMAQITPLSSNCGTLFNALKKKDEVYTVDIGPESGIENFFRIHTLNEEYIFNEQRERSHSWDDDSCPINVNGAFDNSLFPPFIKKDTPLSIVAMESCRVLPLNYQREVAYRGFNTHRYSLHKPGSEAPACMDSTYGVKLPKGMFDASQCIINKAATAFSAPNFYGSFYNWSQHFEGIQPNEELHEPHILLEPITGIPMSEKYRFQTNIPVPNLNYFSRRLSRFSNMIIPTFWYEFDLGDLPDIVICLMWVNVNVVPHLKLILMPLFLILALWSGLKAIRLAWGNLSYAELYRKIYGGGTSNTLLETTFPQNIRQDLTQCSLDVVVK